MESSLILHGMDVFPDGYREICLETHSSRKLFEIGQEMAFDFIFVGCRDGAVVRALASHQCGPGSIPTSGVKCGLSLLVLYSARRGFLRELRFPLSSENKI